MSKKATVNPAPVTPLTLLTLLFIGLKLTGHIDWSWWWVLFPVLIPTAIALVLVALMGVATLIAMAESRGR